MLGPQFHVKTMDDWRRLRGKADEIKQIVLDAVQRGWRVENEIGKHGRLGMHVTVYPPGSSPPYGTRIGGLRTWRKICREADSIVEGSAAAVSADPQHGFDVARQITDEVFGAGSYAQMNAGNPDPRVQLAIQRGQTD